jgi:hypothetical protein
MNFDHTQRTAATHLRAALLAALVLSSPLLAATNDREGALTHNERAAQDSIVHSPNGASKTVSHDARTTALAENEKAAQHAIVDNGAHDAASVASIGEATLLQNENAAQRTIVDQPPADRTAKVIRTSAALGPASGAVHKLGADAPPHAYEFGVGSDSSVGPF